MACHRHRRHTTETCSPTRSSTSRKAIAVQDTSWIKPGKVAWDWWNANNVDGVDFKAGINTQTYEYYVDFAAKYGLPYIILDEGWYKLGNVLEVAPEINMDELAAYAKQKNVGIILWVVWKTLDDQLIPALDQFEKWGVKGIKVDFMQRSDQILIDYYYKVSRECAKRKMLVDFHGDQKPASMTRTWPNLISTEGVRGMEWSKWSADSEPEHNVTLPFTACFSAPWTTRRERCETPPRRHSRRSTDNPWRSARAAINLPCMWYSRAHLQMLSDSPSNYLREPEAMEFLTAVPTEWDETKVLDAKIAEYVAVARSNGNDWYIGAMSDWTPHDLESISHSCPKETTRWTPTSDGVNADRNASDYKKITMQVNKTTKLKLPLASGGGWAARIHQ